MRPQGKQGDLEKKLDSWLGIPNSLANQEKIQKATSALMRDVYHCIQTCGDKLSDGEVKTLKKAIYKFVQKRNVILARRIIQALDGERWDMLRIELVTFSRAGEGHIERMGIKMLPPHPYQLILERVDRLDRMYRLNINPPSKTLLNSFIEQHYPICDRIQPSESAAKHKIMGYFDLLDSSFPSPNNCWIMLTELPLFDLSSTSIPSEAKATIKGPTAMPIETSTFFTGRADMVIVCLAGKNKPIIQAEGIKEKLIESTQGPLTYETLFTKLSLLKGSTGDEDYPGVESLQFLLIEAKTNQPNIESITSNDGGGDGGVGSADEDEDEEEESEGSPGRSLAGHATDTDLSEVSDEGGDGSEGQGQEEGEGQGGGEGDEDDSEDGEEREDTNDVQHGSDGVRDKDGVPSMSLSILEKSLPQIVSECVALRSGLLPDKIIKFTLSDGDNWIFGLVDCVKGKNGRLCHRTTVSVDPKDSKESRQRLEAGILKIVEFFAFWAIVPGAQLKKFFPNKQEEEEIFVWAKD